MDLWIRSQDRQRLVKANTLELFELETDVDPRYNHFAIYINEYLAGEYKTKERALEVLDEINEHIEKQGQTIAMTNEKVIVDGLKYYGKTYVMPKE